jgi:hypothetical protein
MEKFNKLRRPLLLQARKFSTSG